MKARLATAAFLLAVATNASAALINSGFETGNFTGWLVGGVNGGVAVALDGTSVPAGLFQPAFSNVRSGQYSAYGVTANSNGEFVSLSQVVALSAGQNIAGFYMGHNENSTVGIDNAVADQHLAIFVDGVLQPFTTRSTGNSLLLGTGPLDMYEFSSVFAHSGGLALVEFRFSGSGTGRAVLSVDDFFAGSTSVPEPASVALLSMGLALGGIARARRARR